MSLSNIIKKNSFIQEIIQRTISPNLSNCQMLHLQSILFGSRANVF